MSNEELMRPRYKVIADYPGNIMPVGSIFWDDVESIEIITPTGSRSVQGSYPYRNKDKFPHLFKKLEWWEDRRPEDMPKYLNCPSRKMFFRVERWHKSYFIIDGRQKMQYRNYIPASQAEYEQYINQK